MLLKSRILKGSIVEREFDESSLETKEFWTYKIPTARYLNHLAWWYALTKKFEIEEGKFY